MKQQKILISLDCLFDVKLACVLDTNIEWGFPLIEKGYLKRVHNKLSLIHPDIDDTLITARWLSRDVELLKITRRTNMVNLLKNHISESLIGDKEHPQAIAFKLVINTYPYVLTQKELYELFTCFEEIFKINDITRVHVPPEDITPTYLKGRFHRFIIYDFNEWSSLHKFALAETPIPLITCVAPMCYHEGKETESPDEQFMIEKWMTAGFARIIDLEFVPLSDMSVCLPLTKKEES